MSKKTVAIVQLVVLLIGVVSIIGGIILSRRFCVVAGGICSLISTIGLFLLEDYEQG